MGGGGDDEWAALRCLPGCWDDYINSSPFYAVLLPLVIWVVTTSVWCAPKRFDEPGHVSLCRPRASPGRYPCGPGRAEPSLHTRLARYRRHYSELYLVRSGALPPIPTHMRLALRAAAEHSLLRLFQPMQVLNAPCR